LNITRLLEEHIGEEELMTRSVDVRLRRLEESLDAFRVATRLHLTALGDTEWLNRLAEGTPITIQSRTRLTPSRPPPMVLLLISLACHWSFATSSSYTGISTLPTSAKRVSRALATSPTTLLYARTAQFLSPNR